MRREGQRCIRDSSSTFLAIVRWLMENGDEKRVKRFNEETYMHFFIRMLELKNRHSYKEIGSSIVAVVFMSNGSHPNESEACLLYTSPHPQTSQVIVCRLLFEKNKLLSHHT